MEYALSGELRTNLAGFRKLVHLYDLVSQYEGSRLKLNFGKIKFFDANMSAVLLAILQKLESDNNNKIIIDYDQIDQNCEVLRRNGFVSHLSKTTELVEDIRKSTVPLKTFKSTDADAFVSYIENDFLKHRGLDGYLTKSTVGKIKDSFLEIFCNVELHAQTNRPMYTCGQYYPTKKEFKFTVVDVGVGFLKNINKKDKTISTYEDAIDWAVKGNSTKNGSTQGGTGLSTILRYCSSSKGEIHIVSGDCYWSFNGKEIEKYSLSKYFCGSTVHLIFRY
jgi:hypothetical protein